MQDGGRFKVNTKDIRKIGVGSQNSVKVDAVREVIDLYFPSVLIRKYAAPSGVSEQPVSLEETIQGAKNRAVGAFVDGNNLGIGIESGLISVLGTKTGMMDTCVCAIFDGDEHHLGLSPCFECPPSVIRLVRKKGYDLDRAFYELGMTDIPRVGHKEGVINILTCGAYTRKEYTKPAIIMAMVHLLHPEWYRED